MKFETHHLSLALQTRDEIEHMLEQMPVDQRAQVSPDWLARLRASGNEDPWARTFQVRLRKSAVQIGSCGFKGPPVDGVVEVAYVIDSDFQGHGYATEAVRALLEYARSCGQVNLVRAHTLREAEASKKVLLKCGFRYSRDIVDPEDGLVSRFEWSIGSDTRQQNKPEERL